MRRKDREITDYNKVLEIMKKCDCCRVGFKEGEGVYIVPLNFGLEADENGFILYFHGAKEGKKTDLIKEQQVVGFEMDTGHGLISNEKACGFSFSYQSVIGKGKICLIEDKKEKINGLKAIMEHYSDSKNWEFGEQMLNAVSVMKLTVTEWSCKERS